MIRHVCAICLALFAAWLLFGPAPRAGEAGVTVERIGPERETDRVRVARTLFRHDFENRRDPDSGNPLPVSADLDNDGWPDFWEPVRAVGFPEYLIDGISIMRDDSGQVPGAYRDEANHALRLRYDGTRVGIRTRTPVPVDPGLSYEFSLRTRDSGLDGARLRAGVEWMRVDPAAVSVLRSDDIPDLPQGQADWAIRPARILIHNPPPLANAARLFISIERLPGDIDGSHRGDAWVDDVRLEPHPKISVEALAAPAGTGRDRIVSVRYSGLVDNVPDPVNPGFFRGKRYSRRVEVTDVFNRPVRVGIGDQVEITPDDEGIATENVSFPVDAFGVYYFNIRLYEADLSLATDVVRAIAIIRPPENRDSLPIRSVKPAFGIRTGIVPDDFLFASGRLGEAIRLSGASHAKLVPWGADTRGPRENGARFSAFAEEIRILRSAGIRVTGVIAPPGAPGARTSIADALAEAPEDLNRFVEEAGRRLGLLVDDWQWGDDGDGSLYGVPADANLDGAVKTLREFAAGLPMAGNLVLPIRETAGFPQPAAIVEGFFPATLPAAGIWPESARAFPWLLEPYRRERGRIYPPVSLVSLAPPPADPMEERAGERRRPTVWLSLEPPAAHPHEANAADEKSQLEQFLVRSVYAAILSPETIFVGELFHPERGLLRRDGVDSATLETMARPIYLAAGTLARHIAGAEYLGRIGLLPPFEAHAFRRPGTDQAVIAIWHNDGAADRALPRVEIANGPPMRLEDWAGNSTPLPQSIPVRRTPSFITGLSASLVLTRMSVRVAPEPAIMSRNRRQDQVLEIVNHMPQQAPVLLRLRYAARLPDGAMENNWTVRPSEQRINLRSGADEPASGRFVYSVVPDPDSPVQIASPLGADKSGLKVAQAMLGINTSPPVDMALYLPFRLRSEIDVDIEPLEREGDPHFITLQLKVRWFPSADSRRRGEIRLFPFHMKRGRMRETAAFPIAVKASPADGRGDPNLTFESVEIRIPRTPRAQTWVGLNEEGGSGFYLADVTGFMQAP